MKRRDLLLQIASAVGVASLAHAGQKRKKTARSGTPGSSPGGKLDRIGVSTWSFHREFAKVRRVNGIETLGATLVLLDFPEMVADRYKVHHLEFVAPHFASREPAYVKEIKSRLAGAHSHLENIPVDISELHTEGGLSGQDAKVRENAITAVKGWIDLAHELGARSVRCDPGDFDPEDLTHTIESYRKLAAYGTSRSVRVIIENHGKVGSEHPDALVRIFKAVKSDYLGALPDFGNFPDEEARLKGLPMLFPYAKTVCHAKGLEFDGTGKESKFDFRKCVEISKQAGYKGVYSIEYEGQGDPYDGVQKVINELLRYL